MRPVLLSLVPAGEHLAVAVVSVRPGRRVQLTIATAGLTGPELRETVLALALLADRKGTQ